MDKQFLEVCFTIAEILNRKIHAIYLSWSTIIIINQEKYPNLTLFMILLYL